MKKFILAGLIIWISLLTVSCKKELSDEAGGPTGLSGHTMQLDTVSGTSSKPQTIDSILNKPKDTTAVPYPQSTASSTPSSTCPVLPIYGDSIVYPQPTSGSDYILFPVNNPGPGKYFSWPVGMVLDSIT